MSDVFYTNAVSTFRYNYHPELNEEQQAYKLQYKDLLQAVEAPYDKRTILTPYKTLEVVSLSDSDNRDVLLQEIVEKLPQKRKND